MKNTPTYCWWPHWEDKYIPSILGLRRAFELSLANLSDGVPEAEEYLKSIEGENISDEAVNDAMITAGDIHEHLAAVRQSIAVNDAMITAGDIHEHFFSVRQSMLNVMCVGLWHLVEQQILEIYRERYLTDSERLKAISDHAAFDRLSKIENFKKRLKRQNANWDFEKLPSWSKLAELCLVANTTKHGFGRSADDLFKIRRDLFEESIGNLSIAYFKSKQDEEAEGKLELSLFITDNDLWSYFRTAEAFWPEFSEMIRPDGRPNPNTGSSLANFE